MGWTSVHREPGNTDRDFFEQEFPNTLTRNGKILRCTTVRGVFYAAVKQKDSDETWALVVLIHRSRGHFNCTYKEMTDKSGPVEAHCPISIIDLLSPLPECSHDQEYCRLCGAEVTHADGQWLRRAQPGQRPEVAGPRCYSGYPYGKKAPDGGAPFHEPGGTAPCSTCCARDWRDRCRTNAERAERARTRAKDVRPGVCVRFARPLPFADGEKRDTFIFVARSTFRAPDSNQHFRIPHWRTDFDYEVVKPPLKVKAPDGAKVELGSEHGWIHADGNFPFEVTLTYGADGTPLVEITTADYDTYPEDYPADPRTGVPYLRVWVNEGLVHRRDRPAQDRDQETAST